MSVTCVYVVIALQYDREMSRFLKICSINSYPACIRLK